MPGKAACFAIFGAAIGWAVGIRTAHDSIVDLVGYPLNTRSPARVYAAGMSGIWTGFAHGVATVVEISQFVVGQNIARVIGPNNHWISVAPPAAQLAREKLLLGIGPTVTSTW